MQQRRANDMVQVSIVSSRMVKPSVDPQLLSNPTLPCSIIDATIAHIYTKTLYFYKEPPPPPQNVAAPDFFSSPVLVRALSQVLSLFYPLAGTITAEFDCVCNGEGALFVEAVSPSKLPDDVTPHPRFLSLVPTLDPSLPKSSLPLVMIQITRFQCNSVALGVGIEHHVADGMSAITFLNAWSSLARGDASKVAAALPCFDRSWLQPRSPPSPHFVHDEYLKLPQTPLTNGHADIPEMRAEVRMLDLSVEFLHKLKQLGGGAAFSTYELLGAHVWRCCSAARELESEQESMLVMIVDGRARMSTAAPNYMGNVIFNCCPVLKGGEIMQSSIIEVASKVRVALRRIDEAFCRSAIDFLAKCSRAELAKFAKTAYTFACPNLGFISWAKFPFYEADFGWGKPFHVGHVQLPWEGQAYVYPPQPGAPLGSLRLCVSLQARHMSKFAHLLFHL